MFKCKCGRMFKFAYQLNNHIGYAIPRDDNKSEHTREYTDVDQWIKDNPNNGSGIPQG
jgi:hypothetical protein